MTTFLDLVKANGYDSIQDFLDSMPATKATNDISEARLEKIRRNEAMTEQYLGGAAC